MNASPVSSTWFRAVQTQYVSNPLGFAHTPTTPSRYNAGKGQYPLLYLAPDPLTAILEQRAFVRLPGLPGRLGLLPTGSAASVVVFPVDVDLKTVIDLGDPGTRSHTVQELTGDWRTYPLLPAGGSFPRVRSSRGIAPTQDLGITLRSWQAPAGSHCEAFLAPSAVQPEISNLVVFPDRVTMSSSPLQIVSVP